MLRYITLTAIIFALAGCSGSNIQPAHLRADYLINPVVVEAGGLNPGESHGPRLSWINEPNCRIWNEERQTAWQVLVATSPEKLTEELADVWNSGKQDSPESHLVPYEGPAPEPMTTYYWKVRTWDAAGSPSKWSEIASWGTGPSRVDGAPGCWEARWIGAPWQEDKRGNWYKHYPMFRKEFTIGPGLKEAKAYISGLGWFKMSLNGAKVGDDFFGPGFTDYTLRPFLWENPRIPLDPAVTAYRTLYNGYDITANLKEGANAVSVVLGNGYFHTAPTDRKRQGEDYGTPRLICHIELIYEDGHRESVVSDESWKAAPSPYVFGDLWEGEIYDAREEVAGWQHPGLDDSSFDNAVLRKAPDGPLTANPGPADKVTLELEPISFEKQEDGSFKVDFGKVISGRILFKDIQGQRGDTLSVNYQGEYPSPECKYIFSGNEPVTWGTDFTWYVFREAIISGIDNLNSGQLIAQAINADVPVNSEFSCSEEMFGQILEIFRRAQMDNMHSGIATDCPHRERLPYTGDGQIAMNAVMASFAADAFYAKWIGDILGSQNPTTGHVPNGAPWEPMCGGGIPWGAAVCVMPWEFYRQYGDYNLLETSYEGMKSYVRYLGSWERPDGTVFVQKTGPDGKPFYWYNLGEWAPAYGLPENSLVHTFYYWLCTHNVADAARILGKSEEAQYYSKLEEKIRTGFNSRFYNREAKSFGDFGSNVFALYLGVSPENEADVCATLREELEVKYKGHLNTGFIALRFLFETLSQHGMGDLAFKIMSQKDFPSFGWWLEQGATTSWEYWDGTQSRCHPMFGGGLTWLSGTLAGVCTDPEEPGFRHVIIKPLLPPQLDCASYSTMSPYGKVSSQVSRKDGKLTVKAEIPVGCHGTVILPDGSACEISSGKYTVSEK